MKDGLVPGSGGADVPVGHAFALNERVPLTLWNAQTSRTIQQMESIPYRRWIRNPIHIVWSTLVEGE